MILSKLLSERTDASLSFFLTLSGMIQRAGVDHLILRRLEENVLFIPCLRFLPRSAAHFSVDVMPLRLCDGGCCLAFYQRLRSCLDLYSKQYWSDWVNCSLLYLCGLLLLRAGFTASDICCRCWCRNEIGKNKVFVETAATQFIIPVCGCVRFLLFDVLDLSPGGTQAWWPSCFIKVRESVSAHVAPQAQLKPCFAASFYSFFM